MSHETGAWRIEVSPRRAAAEDHFLTVMQMTDRTKPGRLPVQRLDAGEWTGCTLGGSAATWVVLSRRDHQRSAQPVTFTIPGSIGSRILVTNLQAGRWRAAPSSGTAQAITVTEDAGAAWFEGAAGAWTLSRETASQR
jgi:heparin/heparan-sulfate lyase